MCNLLQLSKCLTRPTQAPIRSFSPDALIGISICKINSASVRYTLQFICLRTGLNDCPGFETGEGGLTTCSYFFFTSHFYCLIQDLKPLVTEQSVWAVTKLVQTQEKSNDCSSQASCLSAGVGIRRAWIIHKVQISPSLLSLLEFCFCLPT